MTKVFNPRLYEHLKKRVDVDTWDRSAGVEEDKWVKKSISISLFLWFTSCERSEAEERLLNRLCRVEPHRRTNTHPSPRMAFSMVFMV
jgi:hypothetical protein